MRVRLVIPSAALLAAISGSLQAAVPLIYTNTSNLLPNAENILKIFVAGTDLIQGENLNFQINDGGMGPIFTGVDIIAGTIFEASNTGQSHPNDPGFNSEGIYTAGTFSGHLAAVSTTTKDSAVATDNGLLATLKITTTNTTGTAFILNMINTLNGGSNFGLGDLSGSTIGLSYPHPHFSIGTADRQWNTNGGGTWDTDANWTPFAPYTRGDIANFLGALTSGNAVISLDGQRVVGTINFNNTAGSYDLQAGSGGSLKLDNGTLSALIACLSGKHAISAPVALTASTNVSVAGGSTLTLSGGVSEAFGLVLSGAGKLILTGTNSYGATNISAGSTLQVGNGTTSGSLGTGAITTDGSLTLANVALPIAVPLSGSGIVTVAGSVVLIHTGTTDNVIIAPTGTLQIGNGGTAGLLGGGSLTNGGLLSFNRSDAVVHAALITGAGTLNQSGAGTTTLAAYRGSGPINVNAGRLVLSGSAQPPVQTTALTIAGTAAAPTAALDIKDGGLIVTYSGSGSTQTSTMYSQIIAGKGTLDGSALFTYAGNGITSSTARTSNVAKGLNLFAVGVLNNADLTAFGVNPQYSAARPFMGQTVASNTVLARYTYAGDINLDGKINIDDYNYIDTAFASPASYPGGWIAGDFNRDGVINIDDYNVIDTAFAFQGSPLGASSIIVPVGAAFSVPEPGSLLLLSIGIFSLMNRSGRRPKTLKVRR